MTSLYIPDLPEPLYTQLQQLALAQHRTLNEEVIALLEEVTQTKNTLSVTDILQATRLRREALDQSIDWPDSTTFIREDRDR